MSKSLIKATWDLTGKFPVITYEVSGLPPTKVHRLANLLSGDRRQRKRGARLLLKHSSFFPARPAPFVIGDELDRFLFPEPLSDGFILELKSERLTALGWEERKLEDKS